MKGDNPPTKKQWFILIGGGFTVLLTLYLVACTTGPAPKLCDYSEDCHFKLELGPGDHICCNEVGLAKPSNLTFKNMCCFPAECPQSKDNPEQCTCEYMVKCFNLTEE